MSGLVVNFSKKDCKGINFFLNIEAFLMFLSTNYVYLYFFSILLCDVNPYDNRCCQACLYSVVRWQSLSVYDVYAGQFTSHVLSYYKTCLIVKLRCKERRFRYVRRMVL